MSSYEVTKLVMYCVISASILIVSSTLQADAGHFRFGHINWHLTDNPNQREVEFNVTNAFTRSLYPEVTAVGQTFFEDQAFGEIVGGFGLPGTELFFGDGAFFGNGTNRGGLMYKVDKIDAANNLILAHAINASRSGGRITHTYNTATHSVFLAEINDFDRNGVEQNNFGRGYRVSTIVNLTQSNASPVSTIAPFITCPVGLCSFKIPVTDGDGDLLNFRLSNSTEAADVRFGNNFTQPGQFDPTEVPTIQRGCTTALCDHLTVDSTGTVVWDTTGFTLGLYSTSITIEENRPEIGKMGKVMIDFLIKISQIVPTNNAPKFIAPTPDNNTVFNITTGDTLTFEIKCKDSDVGDNVIIGNLGLPASATLTPTIPTGNPASTTFSFTPLSAQTVPITFTCTDSQGLSARPRSFTIIASLPIHLNLAKTIYSEKESFETEQNGIPLIVDQTIFAEIFEDLTTKSIVKKQVEVITCTKTTNGVVMQCKLTIPSTDPFVVKNCGRLSIDNQPQMNTIAQKSVSDSSGMNTVIKGNIVKTIHAEREVFECTFNDGPDLPNALNPNDKKLDVVLFTEIWEDLSKLPDNPVVKMTFESLHCVTLLETFEVESCQFRKVFT